MAEPIKTLDDCLVEARELGRHERYLDAGRMLRAVAAEYPESSEVQFLLGVCYLRVGREDLAEVSWRRAVDLAPANQKARAWLNLLEKKDPTEFEIADRGSGAIAGDLDACWDPTA
jgi:Flp pilus assembly protein TadD